MNRIIFVKVIMAIVLIGCCFSCQHKIPSVAEEICQIRDSLVDKSLVYVLYFPPECESIYQQMKQYDSESDEYLALRDSMNSIYRKYVYYDEKKEQFDFRKDVQGNFFTKKQLSSDMNADEKKGYYIDEKSWYDEYDPDKEEDHSYYDFMSKLYYLIVDFNHTPKISDLREYFNNVPTYMLLPKNGDSGVHSVAVDSIDRPYFDSVLRQMQDYIDHKTRSFPTKIIEYWQDNEGFKAANYAHTGDIPDCFFTYIFQYRLIQQIARYCPNIQLLTNQYFEDEMLGLCRDFWYHADYYYVFLKQKDGSYCVDIIDPIYYLLVTQPSPSGNLMYGVANSLDTIFYSFDGNKWHR